MAPVNLVLVEIAYAPTATEAFITSVSIPVGSTVAHAIRQSGLLQRYPTLSLADLKVGLFSKRVLLDAKVQHGDRIEIYRPLTLDPKTARKQRLTQANNDQK